MAAQTKKKKGRTVLIVLLVIAALVIFGIVMLIRSVMNMMVPAETSVLEKKTLENRIGLSGVVESTTFEPVVATLNYRILQVNVKTGDKVHKGDVLATLDTTDLENEILQQQTSMDSQSVSSGYTISDAEKQYLDTKAQIDDGTYPEVRSARLSLENAQTAADKAQTALDKAQKDYDDALSGKKVDYDSQIRTAENSVSSAEYELSLAQADYDTAVRERDTEDYVDIRALKKTYDDELEKYEKRFSDRNMDKIIEAQSTYEKALKQYNSLSGRFGEASNKQALSEGSEDAVTQEMVDAAKTASDSAKTALDDLIKANDPEKKEDSYKEALIAYTEAKAKIDAQHDTAVRSAERTLDRAKRTLDNARESLEQTKKDAAEGKTKSVDQYKEALDSARTNLNDANSALASARETYDIASRNAQSTLSSLKASADKQRIISGDNSTQEIALEILKERLDSCVIYAPCDGTVTAVYCNPGTVPNGSLFLIEDVDSLQMTCDIKEYSIGSIGMGSAVTVEVPSIGEDEFKGTITEIAPAAKKGADGKSDGTATFVVKVGIDDTKDKGVLIGMNAKGHLVTDSKDNVFAVAYDCLAEDDNGSYILVAEEQAADEKSGQTVGVAKRINVTTGLETDTEVEISSDELTDGMLVINNAADHTEGQLLQLAPAADKQ